MIYWKYTYVYLYMFIIFQCLSSVSSLCPIIRSYWCWYVKAEPSQAWLSGYITPVWCVWERSVVNRWTCSVDVMCKRRSTSIKTLNKLPLLVCKLGHLCVPPLTPHTHPNHCNRIRSSRDHTHTRTHRSHTHTHMCAPTAHQLPEIHSVIASTRTNKSIVLKRFVWHRVCGCLKWPNDLIHITD